MDIAQIKGHIVRIGEILRKPREEEADAQEVGRLALNLLEDFLVDHKRQTEAIETLAISASQEQEARLHSDT